ncbi:hypothetical protein ACWGDS_44780 [Streptomyces sp. NPDC055059]
MIEDEIKLKAIAALTALREGDSENFVSDLLGEVIPDQFEVPLSGPLPKRSGWPYCARQPSR